MLRSAEKRTALYVRSSTNVRTTESQLEACRTAEHLGFDVIDEGISGTVATNSRPVEVWSVADLPIPARILMNQIGDIAAFAEAERTAIHQRMDYGSASRLRKESGSEGLSRLVTTSTQTAL